MPRILQNIYRKQQNNIQVNPKMKALLLLFSDHNHENIASLLKDWLAQNQNNYQSYTRKNSQIKERK